MINLETHIWSHNHQVTLYPIHLQVTPKQSWRDKG
jgi:hypothetical protein